MCARTLVPLSRVQVVDDMELGPFGKKIADKIRAQCSPAAVLLLDGAKMQPAVGDLRLHAIGPDGKRGSPPTTSAAALARLEACIAKRLQFEVVDFDVHLDEPSKDWTGNAKLYAAGAV